MSKNNVYPYKVLPLPYEVDAIEPVVSSKTMKLHHDGLYKDYVIKLNQEILKEPALGNYLLEEILFNPTVIEEKHKDKVLTNAGGIYNHELYFNILTPKRDSKMSQLLKQALIKKHHTVEAFYLAITTECLSHQNYDWVF